MKKTLEQVKLPKVSEEHDESLVTFWNKSVGDFVEKGEVIVEVQTEKTVSEIPSDYTGYITEIHIKRGEVARVDDLLATIEIDGENTEELSTVVEEQKQPEPPQSKEKAFVKAPPRVRKLAEELGIDLSTVLGTGKNGIPTIEDIRAAASNVSQEEEPMAPKKEKRNIVATPSVRRAARDYGIQLEDIQGTGKNGRILLEDLEAYQKNNIEQSTAGQLKSKVTPLAGKVAEQEQVDLSALTGSGANGKVVKQDVTTAILGKEKKASAPSEKRRKIEGIRKVVADRMSQSAFTAPHVTLTSEIDMTQVKELRTELLPIIEKQTGFRLSYTEVIIKAVGSLLLRFPIINASLINDEIIYNDNVNIGLAVAVPDGLMVPVIKDVNQKGLANLTTEAKDIGKRARDQKLLPDQLKGSTFTISNLGMYAIDAFTPIINQPETAILGVGRIQDKPVVINGSVEVRPIMTISMSFDHRVIDGAPAAEFLTELKRVLENPFELLV